MKLVQDRGGGRVRGADRKPDADAEHLPHGISEIDHLVAAAEDAGHAGDLLARLGFTVTPISHLHKVGVANRLVLMQPLTSGTANFIEVMSALEENAVAVPLREHLLGGRGYRWMVLSGRDAAQSQRSLCSAGYAFGSAAAVERDWELPGGEVLRVAFDVLMPIHAPLPFNFCEYRTLEHYLRPEFLRHANGARSMTEILCQTERPDAFLSYFENLFGAQRRERLPGVHSVAVRQLALLAADEGSWQRTLDLSARPDSTGDCRVLGCRIQVHSLRQTRAYLREAGIEFRDSALGVLVDSPLRDRTLIAFHDPAYPTRPGVLS